MDPLRPKVGIGALIFKDGKVLMGKRKGNHATGVYGSVGGHLEHLESFEQCIRREAKEEAGIEIENIRFLCLSNFKTYAPKHYVDIGLIADWKNGEPQIMEPDRLESWGWYDVDHLPLPIFDVMENYFEAYKTGKSYFDA